MENMNKYVMERKDMNEKGMAGNGGRRKECRRERKINIEGEIDERR